MSLRVLACALCLCVALLAGAATLDVASPCAPMIRVVPGGMIAWCPTNAGCSEFADCETDVFLGKHRCRCSDTEAHDPDSLCWSYWTQTTQELVGSVNCWKTDNCHQVNCDAAPVPAPPPDEEIGPAVYMCDCGPPVVGH